MMQQMEIFSFAEEKAFLNIFLKVYADILIQTHH